MLETLEHLQQKHQILSSNLNFVGWCGSLKSKFCWVHLNFIFLSVCLATEYRIWFQIMCYNVQILRHYQAGMCHRREVLPYNRAICICRRVSIENLLEAISSNWCGVSPPFKPALSSGEYIATITRQNKETYLIIYII